MRKYYFKIGIILALCLSIFINSQNNSTKSLDLDIENKLQNISLPFIANQGQADEKIKYYANIFSGQLFITENNLTYLLPKGETQGLVLKEEFIDNNRKIALNPKGLNKTETNISVFRGNDPNKWKNNISSYNYISLGEIYKNIDVKLKAYGKNVEKLFTVNPKGDPNDIIIKLSGANSLNLNNLGELIVNSDLGDIKFTKPVAFQDEKEIAVNYKIYDNNKYGFEIGEYDKSKPVVIDPLLASTFLGGTSNDQMYDMLLDSSGDVIVAGYGDSVDYPVSVGAFDESNNGSNDILVSKFNSSLTTLVASTFIGGDDYDSMTSITKDASDNIYICGSSYSDDYPTTGGVYKSSLGVATVNAVVTIIDNDLESLVASTYIGGTNFDYGKNIVLDDANNIYITAIAYSSDYPTTAGAYDESYNNNNDVAISILNSSLASLSYSTFLGGDQNEYPTDIMLDDANNIYVTGSCEDGVVVDFPTTSGAYDETANGNYDAFVAKFNSTLSSLSASTVIGTDDEDRGWGMDSDLAGNIYIVGYTNDTDPDFPTTAGAYDETQNGSYDIFVAKFNPGLTTLSASTFIGGTNQDYGWDIALDDSDVVYITGETISSDFPTTPGAYDESYNFSWDVFITKLDSALASVSASTVIGGLNHDYGRKILLDPANKIYFTGYTSDGATDYPTTPGAYDEIFNTGAIWDSFVSRMSNSLAADATMDHFEITGSASQTAGESQLITITAVGDDDETYTSYTGDHALTFSGPAAAPDGTPATSAATPTFAAGVATVTYTAYKVESTTVDVSDGTYNSTSDASYDLDLTVTPGDTSYLKVTGTASKDAGDSQTITITAYDAYGNVDTDYSGEKSLTFSGPVAAPDGTPATSAATPTFAAGVATVTYTAYKVESTTVDVSDGTYNSTGDTSYDLDLTISPASADNLNFNDQPSNTTASQVISPSPTVQVRDAYNNIRVGDDTTIVSIAFGVNPGGDLLFGTASQTASSGVATFDDLFINKAAAGYTFSASSGILTSDTSDSFNITSDSASYLKVTGNATQTAGNSQTITITAYDVFNNIATSYTGNKALTFSGPTSSPNNTSPTSSSTTLFSSGIGSVDFTAYKAETTTIDVSDGSLNSNDNASYDLDLTVNTAAGSGDYSTVLFLPLEPEENEEITITITAYDAYENAISSGGETVTANITGDNAQSLTITDNNNGTYSTSYTPTSAGTDTINATINSETITTGDLEITITALPQEPESPDEDDEEDENNNGIPDIYEEIDPTDTDAVDDAVDSVSGIKKGKIKVKYEDGTEVKLKIYNYNKKKKTKIRQLDNTGYIAALHALGKRIKIINILNGTTWSSKKLSKKKWNKAVALKKFKLRKKNKIITIGKNKKKKLRLSVVNLKKNYKLGKKVGKSFKSKKAIPKKTKKGKKKNKNKILIKNKKNKIIKKFLYTKKKKLK